MTKSSAQPLDKLVGQRVRMRRLMLGMSQERLAQNLGVAFQQVQKYEKGKNRIGASRLHMIAKALQVEPSFFFEAETDNSGIGYQDAILAFMSTREALELAAAFQKISSAALRKRIVDLVEKLGDDEGVE